MTETGDRRIVVGVDGSEESKEALAWAVRQAALVDGEVEAIMAWEFPMTYYGWVPEIDIDEYANRDRATLDKCVREATADHPDVKVTGDLRRGNAAQVLVDAARNAELLVVGSRGHGAFAGALLGSVSDRCTHHATCPVVVMRTKD
ncbi:MAG: universal stress protein [Streptosporangiales bacterium]|nr:universal stress protein [Streptosporangiales bacterium]